MCVRALGSSKAMSATNPKDEPEVRPGEAEWSPTPGRIGISCSGGGVRSASFCLGGLQQLDASEVLSRADFVSAVSGGAYIAGGWAVANGELEAAVRTAGPVATVKKAALDAAIEEFRAAREEAADKKAALDAAIEEFRAARDEAADKKAALDAAIEEFRAAREEAADKKAALDAAIEEFRAAREEAAVKKAALDAAVVRARRLFSPGSSEERWVRFHSSHLLGSASVYLVGALRLAAGALFGWFLIWLLLFAVASPVGWVMSSSVGHEELQARTPILSLDSDIVLDESVPVFVKSSGTLVGETPVELYRFTPRYSKATFRQWSTVISGDSTTTDVRVKVSAGGSGYVRVTQGKAEITTQPTLEVLKQPAEPAPGQPEAVVVRTQPTFTLTSTELPAGTPTETARRIQRLLESDDEAALGEQTGLTGRAHITITGWQWLLSLGLIALGLCLYLLRVLWRPFTRWRRASLEWASKGAAGFGVVVFAVLVALPWLVQEVPLLVARVTRAESLTDGTADGGSVEWVLALLGVTGLLATALRAFSQLAIKQGKQHLGLVIRIVVAILVPLVALLVTVSLLRLAAANSVDGRYLGFGVGMEFADLPVMAQWSRWLLVLVILAVLSSVEAHAWSLFPFYKRQLNEAYNVAPPKVKLAEPLKSVDYGAGPVLLASGSGVHLPKDPPDGSTDRAKRGHGHLAPSGKAKLVVCCAANVHSKKKAPPGRRAVSMTFDEDWVGSPELGWISTQEYQSALSARRLSDVTVPSLQAISGAAISPGMGKFTMGPLDSMLALLNVRLGVWLPNPRVVKDHLSVDVRSRSVWKARPWWIYYLFEVGRYFPWDKKFVYVSDGGHWENLGLVELLRRGCTEIYCVSAAGDGPESFSTLGEALALARESLGAEFDIDLTDLRAAGATAPEAGRRLRRRKTKKKNAELATDPWSSKPFVAGTFTIPTPDGKRVKGRLLVVEANLTDALPWDVQAWAESNPAFPDDPTSDQLFDHRQFESYRALGWHQLGAGLRSDRWRELGRWTSAANPPESYRPDLSTTDVTDVAVAATRSATTWLHVGSHGRIFVRSSTEPDESWRALPHARRTRTVVAPIRLPWSTHAKRITAAARSEEVMVAFIGTHGDLYWAVLAASLSATVWRPLGIQAKDVAVVDAGEGRWRILTATNKGELRSFLVPGDRSDGYPVAIDGGADWVAAASDERGRTLVAIAGQAGLRCGYLDDAQPWHPLDSETRAQELSLIVTANGPEVLFTNPDGPSGVRRWTVHSNTEPQTLPRADELTMLCGTMTLDGQLQLIGRNTDGRVVISEIIDNKD